MAKEIRRQSKEVIEEEKAGLIHIDHTEGKQKEKKKAEHRKEDKARIAKETKARKNVIGAGEEEASLIRPDSGEAEH